MASKICAKTFDNIPKMFFDRAASMGNSLAILYKDGSPEFKKMEWDKLTELCTNVAFGLLHMGVSPQDRVVIFAPNSYKWMACDIGILSIGGVSVPIYPTSSAQDVDYILHNCEASVAFVCGNQQLGKLLASSFPGLRKIIILDKGFEYDKEKLDSSCISFDDLVANGAALAAQSPELLKQRIDNIKQDDLATLIYTSGTTGTPKGAMLTHGNILSVLSDIATIITVETHEVYLSYLPLSHVFERVAGEFYWIHSGGTFAIAESVEKFPRDFTEAQPSMLLVVPRILDRIHTKIYCNIKKASLATQLLAQWALGVGNKVVEAKSSGKDLGPWLRLQYYVAEQVVLKKIRNKIGTRLKLIVSGSAPALPEVIKFFNAVGICTLEGYGLTETTAPATVNKPDDIKLGSVGTTLKSVELKLAHDDEILVRGPSVFVGYYKNETETDKVFKDGWFHTGDIGKIDTQGHLTITDRKKDLIINAAGKNIAPQKIQALLNEIPIVFQSIVFGDRQKCLIALFTLDEVRAMELAQELGWAVADFKQLCQSKELKQYLKQQINERNKNLADYEKIRQFTVLPQGLSVEEGELTPTMKVKRAVVAERYSDLINSLYQAESIATPAC
jgi:long-chain acyl-CoA synthetase